MAHRTDSPTREAESGGIQADATRKALTALIICPHVPPHFCGIADYLSHTVRELGPLMERVIVAHDEPEARPMPGAELVRLTGVYGGVLAASVRDLINRFQPDVIHLQYQTGMYRNRPAVNLLPRALRRAGVAAPVVTTVHDFSEPYLFPKAGRLRRVFNRILVRWSDTVLVTNTHDERVAAEGFGVPRSRICRIPVGSNLAAEGGSRPHTGFRCGYFGLVTPEKGLEEAVDAIAMVAADIPDIELRIVGSHVAAPGFADTLRVRAEGLGIADRVHIVGEKDDQGVVEELEAFDASLLLYNDGVSMRRTSFLTSMAAGIPTVTSFADLVPEGLEDGGNCLGVTLPVRPEDIAARLIRLAHSPEDRAALRTGARRWAEPFTYANIAARHRELYDRLVAAGRTSTCP